MKQFTLCDQLYAARYENSIIILDVKNDRYISLVDDAACSLEYVLKQTYILQENDHHTFIPATQNTLSLEEHNKWIKQFKQYNLITDKSREHVEVIGSQPLLSGGLREYQWDTKVDWQPFKKTSSFTIFKAFLILCKVHRGIKKSGMQGIFHLIRKTSNAKINNRQDLDALIAAVDAATKLYPKKSYCLAWAATFVMLALKHGIRCHLVVGVQANPFYAHAWAELEDGTIINDDPQVAQVLSILAKITGT